MLIILTAVYCHVIFPLFKKKTLMPTVCVRYTFKGEMKFPSQRFSSLRIYLLTDLLLPLGVYFFSSVAVFQSL